MTVCLWFLASTSDLPWASLSGMVSSYLYDLDFFHPPFDHSEHCCFLYFVRIMIQTYTVFFHIKAKDIHVNQFCTHLHNGCQCPLFSLKLVLDPRSPIPVDSPKTQASHITEVSISYNVYDPNIYLKPTSYTSCTIGCKLSPPSNDIAEKLWLLISQYLENIDPSHSIGLFLSRGVSCWLGWYK